MKEISSSGQYILLIEDDIDISEAIKSIIEDEEENDEIKVICAPNGKEALDFLAKEETIPTLILLDLMMPIMNGYEFREAQLKIPRIANIPTIVLSANGKMEEEKKLIFTDYLKKPLDLSTLVEVVKKNIL